MGTLKRLFATRRNRVIALLVLLLIDFTIGACISDNFVQGLAFSLFGLIAIPGGIFMIVFFVLFFWAMVKTILKVLKTLIS